MQKGRSKYDLKPYKVEVKRSSAGLGLFALEAIPKGACVIEYVGRVLTQEEEFSSRSKYLFEVTKKITIDGAIRTNTARYINHACKPNCEIEIYKRRIYVMSKRAIKPGEELTYDYEKDYWNEHIKPKGCRCASCAK